MIRFSKIATVCLKEFYTPSGIIMLLLDTVFRKDMIPRRSIKLFGANSISPE